MNDKEYKTHEEWMTTCNEYFLKKWGFNMLKEAIKIHDTDCKNLLHRAKQFKKQLELTL